MQLFAGALITFSLLVCAQSEDLIEVGLAKLLQQKCGKLSSYYHSYGSREVFPGARPWMALLKYRNNSDKERFSCVGTLITERYVLTTESCLHKEPIGVRLGEHQLSTKEDCRSIRGRRRCTTYEEFGIEEVITDDEHDIALLRLSRDVTIKPHIAPVCLPLNETLQATEQTAEYFSLTGWGFLENPKDSDVLLESYVDAVKSSNAFELWAVRRDNSGCHGDLGSPLTQVDIYLEYQRNVQVGVLISGARDCTEGLPMHFASISAVMPWIAQEIGKADVREFRTMLS